MDNFFHGEKDSYQQLIDNTWRDCKRQSAYFYNIELNNNITWAQDVKLWPDKKKINFVEWLVTGIRQHYDGQYHYTFGDPKSEKNAVKEAFLKVIFRNKLRMEPEDVKHIYTLFQSSLINNLGVLSSWPLTQFINQVERQYKGKALPKLLIQTFQLAINDMKADSTYYGEKTRIKLVEKLEGLLFNDHHGAAGIKPCLFLGDDRLASCANPKLKSMPQQEQPGWYQLMAMAQRASGSKPTKKYLDSAKSIIESIGRDKYKAVLWEWMRFLIHLKVLEPDPGDYYRGAEYISSINADTMKGLVWTCAHFHDQESINLLAALSERAFKKIPGKGPTAASLGNACLWALFSSKGLAGISQLSRLKLRIRQNSTQTLIEKYLATAAKEKGLTVGEIEDLAVDDYGLKEGCREYEFDGYKAKLTIKSVGKIAIEWVKPDGTPQKAIPTVVKSKQNIKLKKLKNTAKQIEQTLTAQRDRIDRMYRTGRLISRESFEKYYFGHGLMGFLTKRIIWNFIGPENVKTAIFQDGCWVNSANDKIDVDKAHSISLWHPALASLEEISQWREFLITQTIQQPIKQAFREIYLLTDAEINTRIYSNRMAAHLLRQHQFNSLAKARGWKYALMGAFDNGIDADKASLEIPELNTRAEFWISEVSIDDGFNDTGIWNYVGTDQVRFIQTQRNETIELIQVPPLLFSEVMRDVDMFVGVASVGNDPNWRDNGGVPAYRDYWTSYAFGELSELAKSRKEILSNLLPRLMIRNVAHIADKFLVVKGKFRTYKIHIGSTNILMEPNDQYLCIVPDRNPKSHTEHLFIPFEGDNGLSIVLSKAFLLAADDKITDATIISQIERR